MRWIALSNVWTTGTLSSLPSMSIFSSTLIFQWQIILSCLQFMFFFFRIVAVVVVVGLLVLGGVGGVLGWYFTRGKDESLGGPYEKQAVATDNKKCSEIGNKILNSNGSAVDAAIAAMFCLGVINMQSSGVGGGGVMLVYNRTLKKATVIDFRETAPGATKSHMFPPTKTGEDMSKHGLLCSFFVVIYDNQNKIRE